jgi:hypothetical protein
VTTCGTQFDFRGTITGAGCDTFTAVIHAYPDGQNYTKSFAHSCYAPTSEQPVSVVWGQNGNDKTFATFRQSIVPTTYDWGGRTVYETSPVAGSDTCYNEAIDAPLGIPKGDKVTGGGVTIASGSSYGDDIGASENLVTYYRSRNRVPCGYQVHQAIWIQCDAGHSADVNYANYTGSFGFGTTDLTAVRGCGGPAGCISTTTFWLSPTVVVNKVVSNFLLRKKH